MSAYHKWLLVMAGVFFSAIFTYYVVDSRKQDAKWDKAREQLVGKVNIPND